MRRLVPRKAKLDKLCGDLVRGRGICQAGEYCQLPKLQSAWFSKQKDFVWAHIIPRDYLLTRWDLDNALCLHLGCEQYYTARPREQKEMFIAVIGERKYYELKKKANKTDFVKVSYGEVEYRLTKYAKKYA